MDCLLAKDLAHDLGELLLCADEHVTFGVKSVFDGTGIVGFSPLVGVFVLEDSLDGDRPRGRDLSKAVGGGDERRKRFRIMKETFELLEPLDEFRLFEEDIGFGVFAIINLLLTAVHNSPSNRLQSIANLPHLAHPDQSP